MNKRLLPQSVKASQWNLQVTNTVFKSEILCSSSKIKTRMTALLLLLNIFLVVQEWNKVGKINKRHLDCKERSKLSLSIKDMIIYIEKSNEIYKNLSKLIIQFTKTADAASIYKNQLYL